MNLSLSPGADILHKTSNLVISRCCFADDGKEMDKSENAQVVHAKLLFLPTMNMQICDGPVGVAVVVAKAPYKSV